MVTNDDEHLSEALRLITSVQGIGTFECPWCGLAGLSALELWTHQPVYHIYEHDILDAQCPACAKWTSRLTRHISLHHGPVPGVDERTGVFALAIIRRPTDGKFLLVQERYGEGYWVPGGGVDPGESLRQGAIREAREEAGADIEVTGILAVESFHRGTWRRIIFLAEPRETHPQDTEGDQPLPPAPSADAAATVGTGGGTAACDAGGAVPPPPTPPATEVAAPEVVATAAATAAARAAAAAAIRAAVPDGHQHQHQTSRLPPGAPGTGGRAPRLCRCKTLPDVESAGACWVTADQVAVLPLRNAAEPLTWIPWVAGEGDVMPLSAEGCPDLLRVFPDYPL